MKKSMFIAVAAIMMATANVKGQNKANEAAPAVNYEMKMNMNSLSRCLKLNEDQKDIMSYASDNFCYAVARLEHTNEEQRGEHLQDALHRNLVLARHSLDDKQYRLYLTIMNSTLINKGLYNLLNNDEVAMNK